jgi:trans-2,3-dihydro-3-hydroxyanthranilate isomerase
MLYQPYTGDTMLSYELLQVDAFTDQPLAGNPCAVLFDTDLLNSRWMLAISREMNLSETAFVRHSNLADYAVRYFTPAEEIPMAGHPTIATAFALVETGRVTLSGNQTTIRLALQIGTIEVDIYSKGGEIQLIMMTQPPPKFLSIHDPGEVLPIFGLSPRDVLPDVPIQTVSTGTPQLMVPVRDKEVLRRAQVDVVAYKQYREKSDFFSPHLFCLEGITTKGRTFARHFGVPPDTPEDPFTGSATGGMASYLWHYSLIEQPKFIAEQGHWMNRPGSAVVEVIGPRDEIQNVRVGGKAVTVFEGKFQI